MSAMTSHFTSLTIVYSTVYSGADQRKYQSPASLAFVRGIHRWPVNSSHKWPVTLKMFPVGDVIMMPYVMLYEYKAPLISSIKDRTDRIDCTQQLWLHKRDTI